MNRAQPHLFEDPGALPAGMRLAADWLPPADEPALLGAIERLDFHAFRFHGFEGRRRTVSFGWAYDFDGGGLRRVDALPAFLLPLRDRAAAFAGVGADLLAHVLVTEYPPGAAIGWHRDRPEFGEVVGVSLGGACRFRMRRRHGAGWERRSIELTPRSIYLLRGAARTEWEHSIPPLGAMRYSVTFRTVRVAPRPP